MATPECKVFSDLQFGNNDPAIAVHRAFRLKFNCDPPKMVFAMSKF